MCVLAIFGATACAGDVSALTDETEGSSPSESLAASEQHDVKAISGHSSEGPAHAEDASVAEKNELAPSHEAADAPAPSVEHEAGDKKVSADTAERPNYNQGAGFFVRDGQLYDANGKAFRVRGVNKLHWDFGSPGLTKSGSNTARWTIDFHRPAEQNVALVEGSAGQQGGTIAGRSVLIPGNWEGTCKDDPALLRQIVDTWIAQAPSWQKLEKHMILNIANEWGPRDGAAWRDAYVEAIPRLRAAGYHATISVTAGGCGQSPEAILEYGQEVFDADPERNVIFDQHIYGEYQDIAGGAPGKYDDLTDLEPHFAALAKTGLVVVIGEFGPGRDIGPSPTRVDPLRVIELSEKHNLGWLAWAWDDNNLANGRSDDQGFGMSVSGTYDASHDLTAFGRSVVEHPAWGLKALAKPASLFE